MTTWSQAVEDTANMLRFVDLFPSHPDREWMEVELVKVRIANPQIYAEAEARVVALEQEGRQMQSETRRGTGFRRLA